MSANRPFDDDMSGRYNERRADPNRADREISLGTPTILGIFFGLALVCALFFGFGYTMGHKSTPPVVAAIDPVSGVSVSPPKPAAGSLAGQSATPSRSADSSSPAPTVTVPIVQPKNGVTPADAMIVGDKSPAVVIRQPSTPNPPPTRNPPPTANSPQATPINLQPTTVYVVQVAAVSSQDVADILTSSLQKKGYTVAIHREPQDKLLHVQIGPFPDRKEAETMRARVLSDGFNAIVK